MTAEASARSPWIWCYPHLFQGLIPAPGKRGDTDVVRQKPGHNRLSKKSAATGDQYLFHISQPFFVSVLSCLKFAIICLTRQLFYSRKDKLLLSGNNSVVECDLAKVEVAGSNPVSRSIFLPAFDSTHQQLPCFKLPHFFIPIYMKVLRGCNLIFLSIRMLKTPYKMIYHSKKGGLFADKGKDIVYPPQPAAGRLDGP
jgi:hypothetical protein